MIQSYLENKIRTSQLRQKILNERLSFSQKVIPELQGIELETANTLYAQYRKDLENMQLKLDQLEYATVQLNDPKFEVSTLGSILDDSISFAMVQQCAKLMLMLQDGQNYSEKEVQRIQNELQIQRNALLLHTKDTIELSKLKIKLLKEKIVSIQQITVELLNQKIALLDQQFKNALISQKKGLAVEKAGIEKNLKKLSEKMRHLPQKWSAEAKLEIEKKSNSEILKMLTQIVETRNIAMHLDVEQSGPLDLAVLPFLPKPPHLFILSFLAGFFALIATSCYVLINGFMSGFTISFDNLTLRGQKSFHTIPNALLYFEKKLSGTKCIHLIGSQTEQVGVITNLLKDEKVLFVETKKQKRKNSFFVNSLSDLFLSKKIYQKFWDIKKEYDWVFICNENKPLKIDPSSYEKITEGQFIFVKDENIEKMKPFFL